jgi:hypothetical protein
MYRLQLLKNGIIHYIIKWLYIQRNKNLIFATPYLSFVHKITEEIDLLNRPQLSAGSVDKDFRGFSLFVGPTGNFPLMNQRGLTLRPGKAFC